MLRGRVIRIIELDDTHSQVPGLSLQVPGSGVQYQVQVQGPHPYLNLTTRT